jgi:putative transcriptional regulator
MEGILVYTTAVHQLITPLRIFLALVLTACSQQAPAESIRPAEHAINQGLFLVATDQLAGSSFQETVILITHYSEKGATGLAINRPSNMPLNKVFPEIKDFSQYQNEVFLGGPVHPDAVFVLKRTQKPTENMYRIARDLYFSAGLSSLANSLSENNQSDSTRAYIGYSGWAPGQLDAEIHRGDWLLIHADVEIVFSEDHKRIWKKLHQSWSGQWI